MGFLSKIFGAKARVSRLAVVRAINGVSPVSENPEEEKQAIEISQTFVRAWEECKSGRTYEVQYAPHTLDGIISSVPDFWEAFAARGFARQRLVLEEEHGGIVGVDAASLREYTRKRIAEKTNLRDLAMNDLRKATKNLRECDTIVKLPGFELSTLESRLESLSGAWSCPKCGRWYPKSQSKCVYLSCER